MTKIKGENNRGLGLKANSFQDPIIEDLVRDLSKLGYDLLFNLKKFNGEKDNPSALIDKDLENKIIQQVTEVERILEAIITVFVIHIKHQKKTASLKFNMNQLFLPTYLSEKLIEECSKEERRLDLDTDGFYMKLANLFESHIKLLSDSQN